MNEENKNQIDDETHQALQEEQDEYPPFMVKNGVIYKWSQKDTRYEFVADGIAIKERLKSIDDSSWYLTLSFKEPTGEIKEQTISQEQIKRTDLLGLMNTGIDITEGNVTDVRAYLDYSLRTDEIPINNVHKTLGWLYVDGERTNTYLLDEAIGGSIKSKYIGNVNIKPRGKSDDFIKFIINELEDSPYLQLALTLGLTAPILGILAEDKDLENLFVNLSGNSSTGKSTALSLAMSCWGKASVSDSQGSLIQSWSATENAMFTSIASQGLQGFPVCRDECGANNIKHFNNFVYRFCCGMDKSRLNRDCILQKSQTFKTVMISSGEVRIQDLMKEHTLGSSVVRLTEFNNFEWTTDAQQSDRIKRFVSRNYGTLGKAFVKYICTVIEKDEEKVIFNVWYQYIEAFKKLLRPFVKQFTDRIASKYAVFLTTHFFLKEFLQEEKALPKDREDVWDDQKIIDIMIESAKDKGDEINLAQKAYDLLMTFVTENMSHFYTFRGSSYNIRNRVTDTYSTTIWGKQNDADVTITRTKAEQILVTHGYKNPKLVYLKLKEYGALIPENDGNRNNFYNRRTITNSVKVPVIVLKKDVTFDDESAGFEESDEFEDNDNN